jgi:DNA-binding Lrp family transcriptional regulator
MDKKEKEIVAIMQQEAKTTLEAIRFLIEASSGVSADGKKKALKELKKTKNQILKITSV